LLAKTNETYLSLISLNIHELGVLTDAVVLANQLRLDDIHMQSVGTAFAVNEPKKLDSIFKEKAPAISPADREALKRAQLQAEHDFYES
jgi:hypothetical protein